MKGTRIVVTGQSAQEMLREIAKGTDRTKHSLIVKEWRREVENRLPESSRAGVPPKGET